MKRFIDDELLKWKNSRRRKPLLLRGARQVGKTWSVKAFGKKEFDTLVLADLERNQSLRRLFDKDLTAVQICADLEILLNQKIIPGKTLVFFDEIQACPRAITALRYFYEEMPELHVIAAGSLLEFALKDISFPVGRIQFLNLQPLCFAEYLQAIGKDEAASVILQKPCPVSLSVHELFCDQLKRYFFIGGMPESVLAYSQTGSFQESFEVQAEICEAYRMDFAKYNPQTDKTCLNTALTHIAQNIGQQIKYSGLGQGYSNPTLKKAFELLCMARIIRKISSVDPSRLPLGASASSKVFKALMVDIGLMRFLSGMPVNIEYQETNLLNIYRGAMAEQFVGQELSVSQKGDLYYWSRNAKSSTAEVDYVIVNDGRIFPVEVKSGHSGRLRSLHLFLQTYPDCTQGLVFSNRAYEALPESNITFIPLYFVFSATGGPT